ncbi:putative pre-mrna-splicing factor cef1 [Diplodia seriata]|uniref:Putative pre-mrna-splicing factor cef1 n=1 Tax=Diplodia seriata TaxID=420778 RepID=A0A0G2E7Q4_9PEZI|nr:putative pre-mrna-splicing factor cef1 [Diplodia seriata]
MPVVKGGVWTNIEDEIVKVAVSKYGLNQWARVSSLLARKTPKQCKARWNEWLDPSIRKIEWSKEEDEKLLHLAKLMPTQWRTIAPIVGRTATQCLERYQKLLDEAEAKEDDELGLGGPEGGETAAPSADDVRRLRPGELDPDPESKPARPDTIDLDEDEKEMLSEARARLANTQGKKAKRKARERQLEESRRLAVLQKRRELKNAGINIKVTTVKKGQMDYNADIPFEKGPASGFYDTREEEERNERQREAFDPRKQQLANKRKADQADDGEDRKKRKNDKSGAAAISAAAQKAAQMQKIREAEQSSKRRGLALPAPQVSENELEEIVKMGMVGERANQLAGSSDNEATRGLIGNYANIVGNTPIRTPRAPQEEDHIANEIRNARARTETQSALLGGENTEILNRENGMQLVGQTPRDIKLREQAMRSDIKSRFAALPKPKETEWELELPEEQQELINAETSEEDAAIRDQRNKEIREARERIEFARQTQAYQKALPRPTVVDVNAMLARASAATDPVEKAVLEEMTVLIANDAKRFGKAKVSGTVQGVESFETDALQRARMEIALELSFDKGKDTEEFERAWEQLHGSSVLPGLEGYGDDEIDEHQLMTEAFDNTQEKIMATAQQGNKIEKKLALHLGGYQKRAKTLRQKIVDAAEAYDKTKLDLDSFRTLQISEEAAIPRRLDSLREEVAFVSRREREAQEAYRSLKGELDALGEGINGYH